MQRNRLPVIRTRREASSPAEYANPISGPYTEHDSDSAFTALGHRIATRFCAWGLVLLLAFIVAGLI